MTTARHNQPGLQRSTAATFAWAAVFSLFGLLGNYVALPLGFNLNLIFGSVFGLVAIALLGSYWGVLVSTIAASYTCVLWNHPYAFVGLALESVWVAVALRRRPSASMLLIDFAYWLFVGAPLALILYHEMLGMDDAACMTVALKQTFNGLCNAIFAATLVNHGPLARSFAPSEQRRLPSMGHLFFEAMALLLLLPSVAGVLFLNHRELNSAQQTLAQSVVRAAAESDLIVTDWLATHIRGLRMVASAGARLGLTPSPALQDELARIHALFPDLHNVFVANGSATTVAFDPPQNERGESTIGLNFADRPSFSLLQQTKRAVVSDVMLGRGGIFRPIFTISAPILDEGRLVGFGLGAANLDDVGVVLRQVADEARIGITLLDRQRRVVVSSSGLRKPLDRFPYTVASATERFAHGVFLYRPASAMNTPLIQTWRDAVLVTERPIEIADWSIVVEGALGPMQQQVYDILSINLAVIFVLLLASSGLSLVVSRHLTEPTIQLSLLTVSLPEKLESGQQVDWPQPDTAESMSLATNFRWTAEVLRDKLAALKESKEGLETAVAERTTQLQTTLVERETVAAMLRESEKLFREAIEFLPIPIGIASKDGQIRLYNKAFTATFGYALADIPAVEAWMRAAYPDPAKAREILETWRNDVAEAETLGTAPRTRERDVTCKNGQIKHVEISNRKIGDDVIAAFYDVTDRRLAENTLQQRTLELQNLTANLETMVQNEIARRARSEQKLVQQSKLAAMGEMLGAIAHQWRQPLNALAVILQNLRDAQMHRELDDALLDQTVDKAMAQISHMSGTIDDFRNFFKPDKERTRFDAMAAIGNVIRLLAAQLQAGNITWQIRCLFHDRVFTRYDDEIRCARAGVIGYRSEFEHVLMNLITNAREAIEDRRRELQMPFAGKLDIEIANATGCVTLRIVDNGGGIDPQAMARIFDPYFTTKDPAKGTGLGLYMSKIIIEEHMGGRLLAENTSDGARFVIELSEAQENTA